MDNDHQMRTLSVTPGYRIPSRAIVLTTQSPVDTHLKC
jgi:hypothetical protein